LWTNALKQETGCTGKALYLPLRDVLTGQAFGPEMKTLLPFVEPDRVKARVQAAAQASRSL